jgi:hypothetical protein
MNWFRKKKAAPPAPKQFVFKNSVGAFEYACLYLDTSLENENAVLGYVLEATNNNHAWVKLSNPDDSTIPAGSIQEIGYDKNISPSAPSLNHVPQLSKGDLVMCKAPAELAIMGRGALGAIIIDKIKPVYDITAGGWVIDRER